MEEIHLTKLTTNFKKINMKIIRDYTLILLVLATAFTSNAQTYKNVQYGNQNKGNRKIFTNTIIGTLSGLLVGGLVSMAIPAK